MKLTKDQHEVLEYWGEIATRYGIKANTMKVQALLFLTEDPLTAKEIGETLGISASAVRGAIADLEEWDTVEFVEYVDDRKQYYACEYGIWDLGLRIVAYRVQTDLKPTVELMHEAAPPASEPRYKLTYWQSRTREAKEFFDIVDIIYSEVEHFTPDRIKQLANLGVRAIKMMGLDPRKKR